MLLLARIVLFALLQSGPQTSGAAATNGHGVWLSWTASTSALLLDPGTVNVYRSTSTCAAATTFTLQTPAATAWGPWHDPATASATTYCYKTTALIDGVESNISGTITYSNTTQVTTP